MMSAIFSPASAQSRRERHGRECSVDLDADFFDCIDRSDDSFLREFQESLGIIERNSSGGGPASSGAAGEAIGPASSGPLADVSAAKPGEISRLEMVSSNISSTEESAEPEGPSAKEASVHKCKQPEPVDPKLVQTVRAQLDVTDQEQEGPDESMICRFIRATGGNTQQSVQRLNATLKWRAKVVPENIVCMACAANAKSHYMHLCGYDLFNRPIIYSCLANATNKVYLDNYHHMIQTFEMAIKCMPPGVEQWVWVCDFYGFGMADINPKLAKAFLDISAEHYPERLGLFIVAGAPALFSVLWKAIAAFVDPKTHQKIRFLPCDFTERKSKMRKEMKNHFSDSMISWVETEMLQNRERGQAAKKTYDLSAMYRLAKQGKLQSEDKHDLRGHTSLLGALAANPALMEPQATADQYL